MRINRWMLSLLIALPGVAGAQQAQRASASGEPMIQVTPNEAAHRVDVTVDGRPFTSYLFPTTLQKPVLYPLLTASGKAVTRGFPLEPKAGERVDHVHHVGLWFNYGDVNGLDFWNNSDDIREAQKPKMGTIVHRRIRGAESGRGEGSLEVSMDWVDHQGKVLLREDTRFVFHAGDGLRAVDRITTLTALNEPVSFTDNKEGVLGLRVTRALEAPATQPEIFTDSAGRPTTVAMLNNEGVTGKYRTSEGIEGDAVWGTRGRWTTLSGVVEGEPVTVAMLDHPRNVGFPTYWHARGYGLFAANPLGQAALSEGKDRLNFRLAPGESTTFRHRVLILSGSPSTERVEQLYKEWAG
jgi:hypothetical protein